MSLLDDAIQALRKGRSKEVTCVMTGCFIEHFDGRLEACDVFKAGDFYVFSATGARFKAGGGLMHNRRATIEHQWVKGNVIVAHNDHVRFNDDAIDYLEVPNAER